MKLRQLLGAVALVCIGSVSLAQQPIRIGSTLALTGPLAATGAVHKVVGEIYVEQLNKRGGLLGRPGRVDRQGRPVEARPRAHAVRAADHRRQGRPADGPVRHRRHPVGDGRRAALQQGAGAPHVRHSVAGQVRHAVPGLVARPRSGDDGAQHGVRRAGRVARSRRRPIAIVTSKFPSVHFMSLGAREVAKKRGLQRSAVPRMGLRQPRLRPDRRAHQGRQARFRLGRRDRPRRQPAARRDEEDRLRAAAALLHVPGAGPDGRSRRRRRTRCR